MKPLSRKTILLYTVFSFTAGLILAVVRVLVSLAALEPSVGLYTSESPLPTVFHILLFVCILAAFSIIIFSKRITAVPDVFRLSGFTVYTSLVTAFMLFGLDGYLIVSLFRSGFLELQPLFGHTPLSTNNVPLATLPCAIFLVLMLLSALPSAFYFLMCSFSDKCKSETLIALSTTPVLFYILYALYSYFRSDLALNSPVKILRLLVILAFLFYFIQEARVFTEIPQKGLYAASADLAILLGITVSASDIVLSFAHKVTLTEGFFAPALALCTSLYILSRTLMRVQKDPDPDRQ